jgi:4-oxalocrotonate tautomerase
MPEVYVHAVEGRTLDQKRALVQDITAAVVKNFNVPPETVMIQFIESAQHNKARMSPRFFESLQHPSFLFGRASYRKTGSHFSGSTL